MRRMKSGRIPLRDQMMGQPLEDIDLMGLPDGLGVGAPVEQHGGNQPRQREQQATDESRRRVGFQPAQGQAGQAGSLPTLAPDPSPLAT